MTGLGVATAGIFTGDIIESDSRRRDVSVSDETTQQDETASHEMKQQIKGTSPHEAGTEMLLGWDFEDPYVDSISHSVSFRDRPEGFISMQSQIISLLTKKQDPLAVFILRMHYTSQILADMRQIQNFCSEPKAAVFAESLLREMRAMDETSPSDPFLEVVMALHDALAYKNNWSSYTEEQYEGAYLLLKKYAGRRNLKSDAIEKAIMELEEIGFNTTPFEIEINSIDENSDRD